MEADCPLPHRKEGQPWLEKGGKPTRIGPEDMKQVFVVTDSEL